MPLSHPPGQAQCDFDFVLDLPHSDGCFIKAYPAETTEAFLDGHVSAFAFLGGVPRSILYDNTKLAVAKILGDGRRERTRAFTGLQFLSSLTRALLVGLTWKVVQLPGQGQPEGNRC